MQIQLSIHVFGSLKGYTTLAKTADVTSAESTFLERFSFGQTTDQSYLDSLDTNPAFISRPLPSGRWAITRVMKGQPDDYNRQTMLFTTAILTITDWLDILHCNFMPLLQELRLRSFSPGEQLPKVDIDIQTERPIPPAELCEKIIPLLSAIETTESSGRNVILLNDINYNADVLCWLNMLLPRENRKTFSCAGRALSDGLDVEVISMAQVASFGNSTKRPIQFSPARVTDKSPFTQMVDRYWQERGMPPWQFIDKCPSFTFDKNISDFSTPTMPTFRPVRKQTVVKSTRHRIIPSAIIKIILSLLIIAILATTGYFVKTRIKTAKNINTLLVDYNDFISKNKDLSAITQKLDGLVDKCQQLINDIDKLDASAKDSRLVAAKKRLNEWLDDARPKGNVNKTIKDFLDDCGNVKLDLPLLEYPKCPEIERIRTLTEQCKNYLFGKDTDLIEENYKKQLNDFITKSLIWQDNAKKLLQALYKSYEKNIPEKIPSAYEVNEIAGYNKMHDGLEELNKKLKNDKSHENALSSPIEDHSNYVKNLDVDIDNQIKAISEKIKIAEDFKKQSSTMIGDVENYLTNVNNICAAPNCIQRLYEQREKIEDAKKWWPANPKIDEVYKKVLSAINISEAEKYLADMNSANSDPCYVQRLDYDKKFAELDKIETYVNDAKRYWPTKADEIGEKLLRAKEFSRQIITIRKKFSEAEKNLADPNGIQILLDTYTKINQLKEPYTSVKILKNSFIESFKKWRKEMQERGDNIVFTIGGCRPSDPNDDELSYEDVGKILNCLDNIRKDNKENVQTDRDPNSTSTN